jgi:hypothetical protein
VDLTFASAWPQARQANGKSKNPLETYICEWTLIQTFAAIWMQMLESDHRLQRAVHTRRAMAIAQIN